MEQNDVVAEDVVIVDDAYDMGPLAARFVRASPLNGLDKLTAEAVAALFSKQPGE